jgi:hypothetical protein
MPRAIGYKCKTPGCGVWLKVADIPENTSRSIYFMLRLEEGPRHLQCPDCGQEHDYLPEEKTEITESV